MRYLLILFTVFTFGQASNQMVTFTQASSLGFTLQSGQSHVTSSQCMTKSAALAKYNLSAGSMNGFANNQLVPRSAWVSGALNNCYFTDFSLSGSTVSSACSSIVDPSSDGAILCFQGSSLINVPLPSAVTFNGVNFNGGNNWWKVGNGTDVYVFLISPTGVASQREVCSLRTQQFIYTNDPCISNGAMVFLDPNGLYYDSAFGGSVLNTTLYSYNQPNPPLFLWNVWTFTNGVRSTSTDLESSCSPN